MKYILLATLLGATVSYAGFDLQGAIDNAKSGATVVVPKGTYTEPITIKKGIVLKGEGAVIEVESNRPAILIDSYKEVAIEGLTIKWKIQSKPKKGDTPYAVFIRAGEVELENCIFEALGSGEESPCAISARGKSEVEIEECRFNGFEYTIQFWDGAEGEIVDCLVMNPGHCGITIGSGAKVELERNIVTGSRYHGIRCTGGTIEAKSNLVVRNKNRGFYIGNKSAAGEISNNLIVDNATGINVFAYSKLAVENNVILRSSYAGLSVVDTAKLEIEGNIIADNEKGLVGFSAEKGKEPSISINGKNLVYGNKTDAEKIELPAKTIQDDPQFTDPDAGLFKTNTKDMGLEDPKALQALWNKWQAALDKR